MDHTADFLLNGRDSGGTCQEFASAIVMMCRSVGINARVVVGYHGGEFNSLSGYYVVKQKHAHAWAEYYIPGSGWVTSDPTPAGAAPDASEAIITRWIREAAQIVQNLWLAAVVSFDNDSRRSVFSWLSDLLAQIDSSLSDGWDTVRYIFTGPRSEISARVILGAQFFGLIFLIGLFYRFWSRRRNRRQRIQSARRPSKVTAEGHFLAELFRLISRHAPQHPSRRPEQTPREFVNMVAPSLGSAASDAHWLIDTFYALQFGAAHGGPSVRSDIAGAMRRIKAALTDHRN
jgi:hypothetical protein